jgi:hypothetical protein
LEVSRLGKFLGVDDKDGLFEAISRKCQFENMAKDKQEYLYPCGDEETFSFYRKGLQREREKKLHCRCF